MIQILCNFILIEQLEEYGAAKYVCVCVYIYIYSILFLGNRESYWDAESGY